MKKILFSPVGNTDFKELENAPTFRIAKFVKPDKIVLYCNSQLFEQVDPFADMLKEELKEKINVQIEIIKDAENTSPDDYNYAFNKFNELISNLIGSDENELFLNAGSGTPAYKSALMYFANQMDNVKAFQAPNPMHSSENVREISNSALINAILVQKIRALVDGYDYSGAVNMLQNSKIEISEDAKKLIFGAKYILILNSQKALENFQGTIFTYDTNKPLIPYLNMLQVKILRDEYGDFARAVSPAISEVLNILLKNAGVKRDDYSILKQTGNMSKKSRVLDIDKVKSSKVFKKVFKDVLNKPDVKEKPYFYNTHLNNLLKEVSKNELHILLADDLIRFEGTIRNMAAHEMVKIDKDRIIKATRTVKWYKGRPIEENDEIYPDKLLEKMAEATDIDLNLLNRINEQILGLL